ncbi:MAG TPA: type II secretion system F family protein [Beijerinckiaceae bacterium]|jgi:tight adherence protein B|nr:type II secretion system F family protein [Beijerinckiaceae bacterium]
MSLDTLIFAGLTMIAVGGIFYAFVYPYLSGEKKVEKRKAAIQGDTAKRVADAGRDVAQRRKQIVDSLKELEARDKSKKLTLDTRIGQAGLNWSKGKFFAFSACSAAIGGLILLILSGHLLYFALGVLIGGLGLPRWILSFLKKRRIAKFIEEFPNAVDVIIRGIKAGLPLGDCLRIIANEAQEPVKSEFRYIVEAQTLGLSAGEAVERLIERIPVAEANFFSIVIGIQQKSGGNLSEALGNLSRVLRDRKKMKQKIQAMSGEAKASAMIIGSLPFIVTVLVYLSSPKYIELLWTTSTGEMVVAVSAFWMCLGVAVMRKMINFDF